MLQERRQFLPEYKSFVSGIFASWCAVLVGQPLDIIKVRMQNTGGSTLGTIISLVRYEGIFAFWKASLPPIIGSALACSFSLGTNENTKRIIRSYNKPGEKLSIWQHSLCGASAGIVRSIFACPSEHITIKIQIQGKIDPRGDPTHKNSVECFRWVWKHYGLKGLYKGYPIALVRDLLGGSIFWGSYQLIGRKLFGGDNIDTHELNMWKIMCCGGFSGTIFWIGIFAMDIVKTKFQSDSFTNPRYKSIYHCFRVTLQESGFKGLYRGFLPALIRAFPVNAAYIAGFESGMSILGRDYK